MKVLVIGNGGREHALVWKLAKSPLVTHVLWAPGNFAAVTNPKVKILPLKIDDLQAITNLAQNQGVSLVVVGPEGPLVGGIGDMCRQRGISIFGPSCKGAQLEGSKVFAKKFFVKHGIPTAQASIFTKFTDALAYARTQPKPLVIKADGLAAGKGVIICKDHTEVEHALQEIMEQKVFGEAGRQVLIEECLSGTEVSVHAITDGETYQLLASAQDHKRIFDGDLGPNTGGMGAYSPAPIFTKELEQRVRMEIFERTLAGLRAEGIPYCGVLYAGLMLTSEGPKILEYNCRFGDPETQVILARLENDLMEVLFAACNSKLKSVELKWKSSPSVCVVLTAEGYPGAYRKGDTIQGLEQAARHENVCLFHAGTSLQENRVVTSGGRVLGITTLGENLREALERAYSVASLIQFEGKHYRHDIAAKAFL